MKKIRAILLDFDGTSLQQDQMFISLGNKRALWKALDMGIEIIPCTGRNADMIPPQIEAEPRIRYMVTSNGGRVIDRKTGKVIYQSTFTPEETAHLCRLYEGGKMYSEIAAEGKLFIESAIRADPGLYSVPRHHVWYIETNRPIPLEKPSEYFLEHRIGAEKFNIYGVPEYMQESLIRGINDLGCAVMSAGAGKNIQFFPKRQSRVKAMNALFEFLGYGFESMMSLGDSALDADMIAKSAIGVAMGNAPDEIKAIADYVTAPYDEDGVAEAIYKFLFDGKK
ncbi:MAG: HAD hydrolase family protein [Clostridia bacterium]|nr:HAD hydrolase family protein [Clostridia bacterium]